ncbi:leucine-rich repeat domain-containing protein [Candidatus Rhabdochlamydia oedothoracis]|uniref:leucine-rich repeat domain-containing protein n=1 Tax=Candidatus Rhabdochlamydia oedothoracis TaxID=2720720 RepID=UPI001C645558|nr:leucine-rich repeat domain-containing protein [Candidatus Rhabdochlamydia oedothoracis]
MSIFQDNLNQLKTHSSEFKLIDKAIQRISKGDLKPQVAWKIFNDKIADYKTVINPFPVISCLQDLQKLEIQLEDHFLEQLWNVLIDSGAPQLNSITKKREWFEDEKNQSLLDTITVLDLRNSELIFLPREMYQLRNLKKLDLSQNQIEFLPESIKVWTQLEELDLSFNQLITLPDRGIEHLTNLKNLNVSGNTLKRLPRSIGYLKNLKILNVEENCLKELPKEIRQCSFLEVLKVSSNELSQLPRELKDLTSLTEFSAADNELRYSSEELQALGVNSWEQIEKVDLSQNYLNTTVEVLQTLWTNASIIRHSHYEKV